MHTTTKTQQAATQNHPHAGRIYRRIGSTNYKVDIHFSETSKETMNDKITRLIKNETESGKAAGQ